MGRGHHIEDYHHLFKSISKSAFKKELLSNDVLTLTGRKTGTTKINGEKLDAVISI